MIGFQQHSKFNIHGSAFVLRQIFINKKLAINYWDQCQRKENSSLSVCNASMVIDLAYNKRVQADWHISKLNLTFSNPYVKACVLLNTYTLCYRWKDFIGIFYLLCKLLSSLYNFISSLFISSFFYIYRFLRWAQNDFVFLVESTMKIINFSVEQKDFFYSYIIVKLTTDSY